MALRSFWMPLVRTTGVILLKVLHDNSFQICHPNRSRPVTKEMYAKILQYWPIGFLMTISTAVILG